jgi:hypothetical protein
MRVNRNAYSVVPGHISHFDAKRVEQQRRREAFGLATPAGVSRNKTAMNC